ncbi:RNase adapter RapZ [Ferrovibrio xuzhouensis]|uniref:RNase adapter RapZ n=1 Tax=Ferrovibrio xuzhouensis TaxID=1576914 RepID=A0ABV7VDL7_9PROT
MTAAPHRPRLAIVSGLSGAGKSTALKLLEDAGYEAVDNLPVSLLPRLTQPGEADAQAAQHGIAVGVDSRTRDFQPDRLLAILGDIRQRGDLDVQLVYFDCDDDVLLRRFTATRRRHPLAGDRPVSDGIAAERHLMAPLKAEADLVIDTSTLALPGLRQVLASQFALDDQTGPGIMIVSFSYRHGLPREADLVFDVRFLRNPHYDEQLRARTGEDPAVAAYIAADPDYPGFFSRLTGMLEALLPRYGAEGKRYLTIALGCTGGQHRSVFVAEQLAQALRNSGQHVDIRHRDRDQALADATRK